jgi:putative Ca2+/H+ antiporter (TMEM165/GDT1 family)
MPSKPLRIRTSIGNIRFYVLIVYGRTLNCARDKTQLAVIALSVEYGAPLQVFLGVMLAFTLLTALGAVFGKIISKYISAQYLKTGASLIFIVFGVIFLFGALSDINLL